MWASSSQKTAEPQAGSVSAQRKTPLLGQPRGLAAGYGLQAYWDRAGKNVMLCAETERIFHFEGVLGQQVRAVGTEARS